MYCEILVKDVATIEANQHISSQTICPLNYCACAKLHMLYECSQLLIPFTLLLYFLIYSILMGNRKSETQYCKSCQTTQPEHSNPHMNNINV